MAYASFVTLAGKLATYSFYNIWPTNPLIFEVMLIGIIFAITTLALAAGIAILRHRVYDVRVVINRALVYGALTAAVAGTYLLVVGGLGVLLQARGSLA